MQEGSNQEGEVSRELSGEEAAVYDRQIRLWGLAAQQRLAESRVLLLGCVSSSLGCEIAKNVVLAGVGHLDLVKVFEGIYNENNNDNSNNDIGFLGAGSENVARVLREMNPLVEIGVRDEDAWEKFIGEYDVVCCVGMGVASEKNASKLCRDKGCKFFTGHCLGLVGCFFLDLGDEFWYETDGKNEGEKIRAKVRYVSWEKACEATWDNAVRRSEGGWPILCAMREFLKIKGRYPKQGTEEDVKELEELYMRMAKEKNLAKLNLELLRSTGQTCMAVIPPVTAIVGGIWGREVVKCIGRKDEPLKNFFFFNAKTTSGTVEVFGEED